MVFVVHFLVLYIYGVCGVQVYIYSLVFAIGVLDRVHGGGGGGGISFALLV